MPMPVELLRCGHIGVIRNGVEWLQFQYRLWQVKYNLLIVANDPLIVAIKEGIGQLVIRYWILRRMTGRGAAKKRYHPVARAQGLGGPW